MTQWDANEVPTERARVYGSLLAAVRDFLDQLSDASPDVGVGQRIEADIRKHTRILAKTQATSTDIAERQLLPGRGLLMLPPFVVSRRDTRSVSGKVVFGRHFRGGSGAVHGGIVALLFDEVLGVLVNSTARPTSPTARLAVDFRSITPVEEELDVTGWYGKEAGRKRILKGEIRCRGVLCAEAEGLFVESRANQPHSKSS
ncbi:hypothetical protein LH19_26680 (plasmid) [Sphingopyxis macrogoltabida]|nr:hypothetical protein LH19_26680 [Sphingopyxis macrogoltabida]